MIALVAHSGGPTAVLNASLLGIVEEAHRHPRMTRLLGARFGVEGLLADDLVDLLALSAAEWQRIGQAPGSALGTSRRAVGPAEVDRILAVCRERRAECLFYTGGNGSMETARRIGEAARRLGQNLAVIGVPKTVDNDLAGTDHAPGYGSAARFFAHAARDIGSDNRALPRQVQVIEVIGRHAGWIAAATTLARHGADSAPHLVYLPEIRLPADRLLGDVQAVYDRLNRCVLVVCEGQLDDRGEAFGADVRMASRGPLATNLGQTLAALITRQLGLKARAEKPGLLGRSSRLLRSDVDWQEARRCGRAAVRAALGGAREVMVTLVRHSGETYEVSTGLTPLDAIAGTERLFPSDWVGADGHTIAPAFATYAAPLIGPLDPPAWVD